MKALRTFLLLVLPIFILAACSEVKTSATGHDDEILLFTDDETWALLEPAILQTFQDTVITRSRCFGLFSPRWTGRGRWQRL